MKRDAKKQMHLQKLISHEKKDIKEAIEFFDADEAYEKLTERINSYLTEEVVIREMIQLINTEEYRVIRDIERNQKELAELHQQSDSQELKQIEDELQTVLQKIYSITNAKRKQARDLVRDHQKMRDQSFLSVSVIDHKVKRLSRRGKKEASQLKKLNHHIKKGTENLPEEVHKLHNDILKEEQKMEDEIQYLAKIEQYLIVLAFRNKPDDITTILKQ